MDNDDICKNCDIWPVVCPKVNQWEGVTVEDGKVTKCEEYYSLFGGRDPLRKPLNA